MAYRPGHVGPKGVDSYSEQPPSDRLIGLSVSLCVADVVECKVREDQITCIISGTAARTPAAWNDVIDHYRQIYWRRNPDLGEEILRRLIAKDRVFQPRFSSIPRTPNLASGHWVRNVSDVRYHTETEGDR